MNSRRQVRKCDGEMQERCYDNRQSSVIWFKARSNTAAGKQEDICVLSRIEVCGFAAFPVGVSRVRSNLEGISTYMQWTSHVDKPEEVIDAFLFENPERIEERKLRSSVDEVAR